MNEFIIKSSFARRNKNPLNIRSSKRNKWVGQVGSNRGFCVFDSVELGYRAAIILICNYVRMGCNTPEKIIYRFAPPSENDTEHYVNICTYPWHRHYILSTIDDVCILVAAMANVESGSIVDGNTLLRYIVSPFKIKL